MADQIWLSVQDIVEKLGVHEQTVRRWLREGRLLGRNFGGRTGYRVRERDFELFLSAEIDQEDAERSEEKE